MISSSLLFVLWHCRHLWLRRRRAEEEAAEWEVGNVQHSRAEGAPSFVIARLPVFKYNPKGAPEYINCSCNQRESASAAAADATQAQDQVSSPEAAAASATCRQPSEQPTPPATKSQAAASTAQHIPSLNTTGSVSITIKPSLSRRAGQVLPGTSSSRSRGACCSCHNSAPPSTAASAKEAARTSCSACLMIPGAAAAAKQEADGKANHVASGACDHARRSCEVGSDYAAACSNRPADGGAITTGSSSSKEPLHGSSSRSCEGRCTCNLGRAEDDGDQQAAAPLETKDGDTACVICLCDYEEGEHIKQLPCKHCFHMACIDPWLARHGYCPLCRQPISQLQPVHVLLPLWLELALQRAAVTGTEMRGLRGPAAELAAELGLATRAPGGDWVVVPAV